MSIFTEPQIKYLDAFDQIAASMALARVSVLNPKTQQEVLERFSSPVHGLVKLALGDGYMEYMEAEDNSTYKKACLEWLRSYAGPQPAESDNLSDAIVGTLHDSCALGLTFQGSDMGVYLVKLHRQFGPIKNVTWRETDFLHPDERVLSKYMEKKAGLQAGRLQYAIASLFENEVSDFARSCGSHTIIAEYDAGSLRSARMMKHLGYSVFVNAESEQGAIARFIRVDDYEGDNVPPAEWVPKKREAYHLGVRSGSIRELTGKELMEFYTGILEKGFEDTAPNWTKEDVARPIQDMAKLLSPDATYVLKDPVEAWKASFGKK